MSNNGNDEFFFALIRITCAQLFRSAGLDRCTPSTLDTIADLLIRHLNLLSTKATNLAHLSGRDQVVIQDMSKAMEEIGLIKPFLLLDELDLDPASVQGFNDFIEWAKGPIPAEARRISKISALSNGNSTTSNAAAAVAVSSQLQQKPSQLVKEVQAEQQRLLENTETGNNDNDDNNNNHNNNSNTNTNNNKPDTEWLTALMKKQTKVGHEGKFKGTVLGEDKNVQNGIKISGGPPTIYDL